jgi:regulator of nucleoside diphosphate kinase
MWERRILVTEEDIARLKGLVSRGRATLRRDQAHLEELEQELERAEVVHAGDLPPDVVTVHSTVRIRDLDSGVAAEYTIVFPTEADTAQRRISVLAPIGTALIGYRVGDVIEWSTPGGVRRLQVEAVLFQPEADERARNSMARTEAR